jgi:hypothetical protein
MSVVDELAAIPPRREGARDVRPPALAGAPVREHDLVRDHDNPAVELLLVVADVCENRDRLSYAPAYDAMRLLGVEKGSPVHKYARRVLRRVAGGRRYARDYDHLRDSALEAAYRIMTGEA